MGITKQEMSRDFFDADLKKNGSKALKVNKTNLAFVALAMFILQVADAGAQWLMGGSASNYSLDTFVYAAVVFIISKCIYCKYLLKDAKSSDKGKKEEDEPSEEVDAEVHFATVVKDTRNYFLNRTSTELRQAKVGDYYAQPQKKAPPAPKSDKSKGKNQSWVPAWLKEDTPLQPKPLNAKAKKFVPAGPSNTLDSAAPLFLPTEQQVAEYQLLQSECGGVDAGAVVYRSRHWLKEICLDSRKEVKSSRPKSKSPQGYKKEVPAQKVQKGSKSPTPAPKKKWQEKVNPADIKWSSTWSTLPALQTAFSL